MLYFEIRLNYKSNGAKLNGEVVSAAFGHNLKKYVSNSNYQIFGFLLY